MGMIDSGSSETFIGNSVAKLMNLTIFPKTKTIALADNKQVAKIVGQVIVDIKVNSTCYDSRY